MDILRDISWGSFNYSDWAIAAAGRRDGRLNPPIPDPLAKNLPPKVVELHGALGNGLWATAHDWEKSEKILKAAWREGKKALARCYKEETTILASLVSAETEYELIHKMKPPASDSRFLIYKGAMVLLAVGELPLNSITFRVVGESDALTLLMTGTLAASVVGGAHYAGICLRREKTTGSVLMAAIALCVMLGVAWIRSVYLAHRHVSGHLGLPMGPSLFTFLSINCAVFAISTAASFFIHDELLANVFRFRTYLRRAEVLRAKAEDRLERCWTHLEEEFHRHVAIAKQKISNFRRLVQVYFAANLQARRDRHTFTGYPACYCQNLDVDLPEPLRSLTWESPHDTPEYS